MYTVRIDDVSVRGVPHWRVAAPTGGAIGFASGVVGIGGGVLLSPILLLKGWATPKNVAATAALFVWVNSLASLGGVVLSDQLVLDVETLVPFVVAVLIGGFVGSRYGAEIAPQLIVRRLLGVVLLLASAKRLFELILFQ